ncbi:MAG TPA: alpha/beta hydrolase [Acidiferrobacterales bacterium]|nr:alpha/beta hydrolase [Acidiferrobacterales bacterium]
MNPIERTIEANNLRHHILEWNPDATGAASVVILHGFLDLAWSFERVAVPLAGHYHVIAPDFRGHGDSEHVSRGGYYYFPDYTADLARLLPKLTQKKLYVVGHSMGGIVASYFAGAFPERVARLALLEGIGPPASRAEDAPDRLLAHIRTVDEVRARPRTLLPSIEAARQRLLRAHPKLDPGWAGILAERSTKPAPEGPPASRIWKFDPLHKTRSPFVFEVAQFAAFVGRIQCPVLMVDGAQSNLAFAHDPERQALYPNHTVETMATGHMMHLERPQELAALLLKFFNDRELK